MSNKTVYQCDRCGAEFDTIEALFKVTFAQRVDRGSYDYRTLELCSGCFKPYRDWMITFFEGDKK